MAKAGEARKTAGKSGREGPGHVRAARNPLHVFTWLIAVPAVAVYLVVCLLVLATLSMMTGEINRIDSERSDRAIAAAVDSIVDQLGDQVQDESTWTEAYLNTYVDYNAAWLDGSWGATARANGSYDTAIVTDAAGKILFGESARGTVTGKIAEHFSAIPDMIEALGKAVAQAGDDAVVAHWARSGNTVTALAAGVIHAGSGQTKIAAADRRILWLGRRIDTAMLEQIADRFQVPLPRLAEPVADDRSMVLRDGADISVGTLSWQPLRPGDPAFAHATSFAAFVLLGVGVLLFFGIVAFRRSEERRAEADARDWDRARFDPVTGLLNRFGLEEVVAAAIPGKGGELPVGIAHIEFEGLKDVGGSYGTATAERLLQRLADVIDAIVDEEAHVARLGPEEFALCRTGAESGAVVRRFAQAVIEMLAEDVPLDELRFKLGASIGVAEATVGKKTIGTAFNLAAAALQRARETGGNHIVEHDPSLEESRQRRLALQADIRRGLEYDEFDLEYQPIFDFATQTMLGVEALLRWPRRTGGPMSPAEFIPAAEASGLIEELGLFALRRACRDMVRLPRLKLSVNVSTVQFRSPTLLSRIDAILASSAFPVERLQLEITESFLLTQPDRAKHVIEELRRRGITIALDDFGTGYSSVGYLQQFQFDGVKLDRSLVDGVDRDAVKTALVESTLVFAFAMGLSVTAEGVERREEAALLARLGCREFQGFLFSRPLRLEALERLLDTGTLPLKQAG